MRELLAWCALVRRSAAEMISLRLAVPAVLGAAALAGFLTYFVTPPQANTADCPTIQIAPTAPMWQCIVMCAPALRHQFGASGGQRLAGRLAGGVGIASGLDKPGNGPVVAGDPCSQMGERGTREVEDQGDCVDRQCLGLAYPEPGRFGLRPHDHAGDDRQAGRDAWTHRCARLRSQSIFNYDDLS